MPKGDPDYWTKTHEPLNIELQSIVRGTWADQPPVADLQLQYIPHYAGKHCLESVRLSRLANEDGAHAVAVGLLRDAVEALSLIALGISHDPNKIRLLNQWNEERISAGELRRHLETKVWPQVSITGLWGESWDSFWASLARSVQPYAHFSPLRMRWRQHVQIIDGKWHIWINHLSGDFEIYRAARGWFLGRWLPTFLIIDGPIGRFIGADDSPLKRRFGSDCPIITAARDFLAERTFRLVRNGFAHWGFDWKVVGDNSYIVAYDWERDLPVARLHQSEADAYHIAAFSIVEVLNDIFLSSKRRDHDGI